MLICHCQHNTNSICYGIYIFLEVVLRGIIHSFRGEARTAERLQLANQAVVGATMHGTKMIIVLTGHVLS